MYRGLAALLGAAIVLVGCSGATAPPSESAAQRQPPPEVRAVPSPTSAEPAATSAANEPTPDPVAEPIMGVLPNGDRYIIESDPALRTEVVGMSVGILIDLDDGVEPLNGAVVGIANFRRSTGNEQTEVTDLKRIQVVSGEWYMTIDIYDHVTEGWEESAASTILDAIDPIDRPDHAGLPAFKLHPPLRWATDDEIPLHMQIMYPEFVVQRGCRVHAVACSAAETVSVVPLDRVVGPTSPWTGNEVSIKLLGSELTPVSEAVWALASSAIGGEAQPAMFWTGSDVLVLRTTNRGNEVVGERWDPATNQALRIAESNLSWRYKPATVWTGEEVLIVGGSSGPALNQIGAAYNPASDSWRPLADPPRLFDGWENLLSGPGVWTGTEMIVWGSELAYNPLADTWRSIAAPPLSLRAWPTTVWTGTQLIIWGGCYVTQSQCDEANSGLLGDGALYDVASDTWTELPPGPLAPAVHVLAGWTGSEVLFFVTDPGDDPGVAAAALDPETMEWREVAEIPLPARRHAAGVWAGDQFVLWGGQTTLGDEERADGATYDPVADRWMLLPESAGPGRSLHSMIYSRDRVYISATRRASQPLVLTLPPAGND